MKLNNFLWQTIRQCSVWSKANAGVSMVTAVLSVQMVGLVARWWCKYP